MHDYSEFTEAPTDENYARLTELVDTHTKAVKEEAEAAATLKKAKAARVDIEEKQLPALMDKLGLPDCSLKSGAKLKAVKQYFASISAKDPDERKVALDWVNDSGNGSLIKRQITVRFKRDEQKAADELLESIAAMEDESGKVFEAEQRQWIETNTLKSFVKNLMEAGELDEEGQKALKVHARKIVKITLPK